MRFASSPNDKIMFGKVQEVLLKITSSQKQKKKYSLFFDIFDGFPDIRVLRIPFPKLRVNIGPIVLAKGGSLGRARHNALKLC